MDHPEQDCCIGPLDFATEIEAAYQRELEDYGQRMLRTIAEVAARAYPDKYPLKTEKGSQ